MLEAFAAGCPVVPSHVGSLPEVCGNAACFVYDPESIDEITAAFDLLVHNVPFREQLKVRGFKQVKQFSWKHSAQRYLAVYNDLLSTQ